MGFKEFEPQSTELDLYTCAMSHLSRIKVIHPWQGFPIPANLACLTHCASFNCNDCEGLKILFFVIQTVIKFLKIYIHTVR